LSTILLAAWAVALLPGAQSMASPAEGLAGQDPAGNDQVAQKGMLKAVAAKAPDIPFKEFEVQSFEVQSEEQLLALANQARRRAGAPALTIDAGLTNAARIHAQAMLTARHLSHQFDGEPSLSQRLADRTDLQLDREGENVAIDYDAERGHEHLMLSPPHRANLLNPAYNVVGLGVIRSGDRLYIVQDFGHALPSYSSAEVKGRVIEAVNQMRQQARQPELQRRDLDAADEASCSMAQAGTLATSAAENFAAGSTVFAFTSLHPETLPAGTEHAIASRNLRSVTVGACYGRKNSYPTGVYWVVLALE
jgi:uncharacterized protein YkwD